MLDKQIEYGLVNAHELNKQLITAEAVEAAVAGHVRARSKDTWELQALMASRK